MNAEVLIFAAFGVLQIVFHSVHKITGLHSMKKLAQHHWVVWMFHPVVVHTFQDYFIHFVIYSGRIISGH
jgi:hypothetical protein